MKITKRTAITSAYKEGLVSIWWYTDNGDFWDYSTTFDNAVECYGYLQYSNNDNHLTLWRRACNDFVSDIKLRDEIYSLGYKSMERGRLVFNIRAQCYEIICSDTLIHNSEFIDNCVKYFGLSGNRYSFIPCAHYSKQELTGNPALDKMYYENQF